MHYDIDAKLQRALQVRRHESVITNNARTGPMGNLRYLAQICNDHNRVGRGLYENHPGVGLDRCLYVERIGCVYEIKLEVIVREYLREETKSAAVGVIGNDYVLAGFNQPERGIDGCHS